MYEPTTSVDWNSCQMQNNENKQMSVADMVAETASNVVLEQFLSDYVYLDEYSMYYNYENDCYYDPQTLLFYNAASQCYYYYNSETQSYEIYLNYQNWNNERFKNRAIELFGQNFVALLTKDDIDITELLFELTEKCSIDECKVEKKNEFFAYNFYDNSDELDEIFLFNEQKRIQMLEKNKKKDFFNEHNVYDELELEERKNNEINATSASCIRLIEITSKNDYFLHIITIKGGTIGYGQNFDITLNDSDFYDVLNENNLLCFLINYQTLNLDGNVESFYEISFMVDKFSQYFTVYFNENCITSNENLRLNHQDCITLTNLKTNKKCCFQFHIHLGLNTCTKCELGFLLEEKNKINSDVKNNVIQKRNLEKQRCEIVKKIKNSYGLEDEKTIHCIKKIDHKKKFKTSIKNSLPLTKNNGIYANCKASPKPGCAADSVVLQAQKPILNEVNKSISDANNVSIKPENKGFKLLKMMGWNENKGLGKEETGVRQPINIQLKKNFDINENRDSNLPFNKISILNKTKSRYNKKQ